MEDNMHQSLVEAHRRETPTTSALRALRESGKVPGVIYGGESGPIPVAVSESQLKRRSGREDALVQIQVDGETFPALIHEVQRDSITRRITHVDFYHVSLDQYVDVHIPIQLHGVREVERKGGIVQPVLRTVTVRARPGTAPEYISMDVSHLNVGEHVTAAELLLPDDCTLRTDGQSVLASVTAPRLTTDPAAEQSKSEIQTADHTIS